MPSPNQGPRESPQVRDSTHPDLAGQNITIGHLEVYNFPTLVDTSWRLGQHSTCWNSRSTSSSSGPICRICHEGDSSETLLAPCNCMGTIGLVHVSCMERWLSSTETDRCELCHYKFKTSRMPRPFWDFIFHWVRGPSSPTQQRSMIGDMVCFFLLTPIAVASVFLCLDGALKQFLDGSQMEAGCLLGLSTVLASIYVVWISVTIRYYYRNFQLWRQNNQDVHILPRNSPQQAAATICNSPRRLGPAETLPGLTVPPDVTSSRSPVSVASTNGSVFGHTPTHAS